MLQKVMSHVRRCCEDYEMIRKMPEKTAPTIKIVLKTARKMTEKTVLISLIKKIRVRLTKKRKMTIKRSPKILQTVINHRNSEIISQSL